ncbi:MAG: aconitate hydratase, partial [Spirochaetales bacterium]|nr:aconitate hydratase [Spirochaetales bacterium]
MHNPMGTYKELDLASQKIGYFSLNELEKSGLGPVSKLPFSLKILLESLLRNLDGYMITEEDIRALCSWDPKSVPDRVIAFKPARVILQDFTGVPSVVDLAALRSAMSRLGNDPSKINPLIPVDLVIDHSLQVDNYGTESALKLNLDNEFKQNFERYQFLKWGQSALKNFRVVPPSTGIIHQVNLEYLSKLVQTREIDGKTIAIPDSLVGTDSHTTMINGLGVVGWGVGGIEAEAVMLGQPIYMLIPQVTGFRLDGKLPEGTTATDMVLTVTQILRKHNVVGKFVEFYGSGLQNLSLPDRAILANMAPEYGATMGFCPVDDKTLDFMRETGRDKQHVDLVEHYCKEQGLFLDSSSDPAYSSYLKLDLNTIEPSLAGPKRPQDRIPLSKMKPEFHKALKAPASQRGFDLGEKALREPVKIKDSNMQSELNHGS